MELAKSITVAGCLALLVACGKEKSVTTGPIAYCTAVQTFAVSISVRDSITGRALADSAIGTFHVEALTDPLFRMDSLTLAGGRQTGTYSVSVQHAGYQTWTMAGITASKTNECGSVVTVPVTAKLQRAGSQ